MSTRDSQRLAETAAAIMLEEQLEDAARALHIAVKRHAIAAGARPKLAEVEAAFRARLMLLDSRARARADAMQAAAVEAMQALKDFRPRAYGSFLEGAAAIGSTIHIECRCEHPDTLMQALMALNIPIEQLDHPNKSGLQTRFEFKAGAFEFQVHALAENARGHGGALGLAKLLAQMKAATR
jgi:hypothetical protein